MEASNVSWESLPASLRSVAETQLLAGETPLAWFQPDLDRELRFASGLVVLTERRLLAVQISDASKTADGSQNVQAFDLETVAELTTKDQGSVGILELFGPQGRVAFWRYTLDMAVDAHRLVERFHALRRPLGDGEKANGAEPATCPSCGEPLPPDATECPICKARPARQAASSLWRLVRFARPRAGMIALAFALTLICNAVGLVPAYLTKPLTDEVLVPVAERGEPPQWNLFFMYLGGLAGAYVLTWLLVWTQKHVGAWVSARVAADLRNRTYAHLQQLSLEYYSSKRTGDLISRLSTDSDRICNYLAVDLLNFANDVLLITMTAGILLYVNPLLALFTLCPFPLIAWLVHSVRGKLRRGFMQESRAWAGMTSVLADTIPGIRVVKAFAQEHREIDRFRRANDTVLVASDRVNRLWAFVGPTVKLMTTLGLVIIWTVGGWQILEGKMALGVLVMFLAYNYGFYGTVESLSGMVRATQRAGASAHRVFEILDRVSTVPEPVRPLHPGHLRGEIELRDVGFRYGTRPVLHGINLAIQPGEMIGLVGQSGSGKSTLVNLVCRFYDVKEGSIRADGVDIRSFPVEEYRANIGIVLQEPFLFYGTIAENIAYGRPDASRAEIIAAARAARAHDFILQIPDGYDSIVGERGQTLSGGERQRISIARALLIDPRILILDEATSSVDTETEHEIQQALENLIKGRTTIAIAHRLSTLRRADRLVVMERGRIVEIGPHEELMNSGGVYARLQQAQLEMAQRLAI